MSWWLGGIDLKRLATSVVLAGRDNEFDNADMRAATLKALSGYREAMAKFGDANCNKAFLLRILS